MRRVVLIILILAFGLSSADARRRGHRHHHYNPSVYVFPGDNPTRARPRTSYDGLQRVRSEPSPAPLELPDLLNVPHGPSHVIVSIRDQRMTIYRNGSPVAESKVSTGKSGHPTPTGIFSVIQKEKWHESNLYSLAPMPYMQRLTWSGIALHAGIVPGYAASHGCIRLPIEFAKLLWSATKIGTRVIVAPTTVAPVEIVHSRLAAFARKPAAEQLAARGSGDGASVNAVGTTANFMTAATTTPSVISNPSPTTKMIKPSVSLPQEARRRGETVSVFVSRKQARLFVRVGFQQVFDAPVTINHPELELGTHVFTAMEARANGMRWVAVSMPNASSEAAENPFRHPSAEAPVRALAPTAMAALDRVEMPQEAIDRISELLSPGASLIISDQRISAETGQGTDFIVLTPNEKSFEKSRTAGANHRADRTGLRPTYNFAPKPYRTGVDRF